MKVKCILGIVCICYGLFVRRAGSGTRFFMVWIGLGIALLGLAAVHPYQLRQHMPAVVRGILTACAAVLVVLFVLVEIRIVSGFKRTGEPGLDCLIVPGAQVRDTGPSAVLQHRLMTAAEYLRENPDTVCIVSGGQGYREPASEAEVMKKWLVDQGIASGRIIEENESGNTYQNLVNCRKLLQQETDSVGIVTNNFHLFRCCAIGEKAGLHGVCGIAAKSNPFYLPNHLLREFLGVVKDVLVRHMDFWYRWDEKNQMADR